MPLRRRCASPAGFDACIKPPEQVARTKLPYVEIDKASKKLALDSKLLQPEFAAETILAKQQSHVGIVGRLHSWFLHAKGASSLGSIDEMPRVQAATRGRLEQPAPGWPAASCSR